MDIKENLQIIKNKISLAEEKASRNKDSVKLMAVSKFHSLEEIEQAIENGQFLFGENRVQEATEKFTELKQKYPGIILHMIGHLQSNKVRNAVKIADCIQSIDRIELLEEIEKECSKQNKTIQILFEMHTGEESKSGFENESKIQEALELFKANKFPHIIPKGFMTMAPFTDDKNLIRKSFVTLRNTSQNLQKKFSEYDLSELSMGMSGDFELAIEEGASLVRIGTAIFGERNYNK